MNLSTFIFVLTKLLSTPLIVTTSATPVVNNKIENNLEMVDSRIYHGDETDISDVPYTVFLKMQPKSKGNVDHICGGVIIDRSTVITAAHCVQNYEEIQIIAGSSNPLTDKQVQRRHSNEIIVHPAYKHDTHTNTTVFDFALVRLKTQLNFGRDVQAALLPMADEFDVSNVMGQVCGWGNTDEEESMMSPKLLCTSAHILTNSYCDTLQRKIVLSSDLICTGRSSCQGDSGSGLIHKGVLIGIVSFTLGPCNFAVPPVVYGKVTTVLDFIRININNDDRIIFPQSV